MLQRVRAISTLAVSLALAGCFGSPDYEGRLCEAQAACPAGYVCGADGRCHRADGTALFDAGIRDAQPIVDAAADAGAIEDAESADAEPLDAMTEDGGPDAGGPDPARCATAQGFPTSGWEARTFTLTDNDELETCLGVEDLATDAFDRNWMGGGPLPGVTDRFGSRYSARRTFAAGVESFILDHDDGARVWINGVLVYDAWTRGTVVLDHRALSPYLAAGTYDIVIEHFEHNGFARFAAAIERGCGPIAAPIDGWRIAYYRAANNVIDTAECLGVEDVSTDQLDLDWGAGPPAVVPTQGITDGWAAVGVARRTLRGLTRMILSHDDGMRFLAGTTVIHESTTAADNQVYDVHAATEVDLTFELIDVAGNAHVSIEWQNHCDVLAAPNATSWAARYYPVDYDGTTVPPTWTLDRNDCLYAELIPTEKLDFDWMGESPAFLLATYGIVELWGAEFVGPRTFAAATTLMLRHDDGLRMWSDATPIYDSWTAPQVILNGTANVAQGAHTLRAEYFENLGGAQLHINW
jgi:hypothetical protein